MNKYEPLTLHLKKAFGSAIPMSFKEIERVIGAPLPPSAFKHRAWWSNNPGNSVMTGAWLAAGYQSSDVDMAGRKLTFRRSSGAVLSRSAVVSGAGIPSAPSESVPATRRDAPTTLTISGVDSDTRRWLKVRAEAAGTTVEEAARDLLKGHARPALSERLAFADEIRATGPDLSGVDVPGLIREDRDAR